MRSRLRIHPRIRVWSSERLLERKELRDGLNFFKPRLRKNLFLSYTSEPKRRAAHSTKLEYVDVILTLNVTSSTSRICCLLLLLFLVSEAIVIFFDDIRLYASMFSHIVHESI